MESDFQAAGSVPLIDVAVALDLNVALRISTAGMNDGSGPTLARPAMTNIDELRISRGHEPKRTAMALCCSLHILPRLVSCNKHGHHVWNATLVNRTSHFQPGLRPITDPVTAINVIGPWGKACGKRQRAGAVSKAKWSMACLSR